VKETIGETHDVDGRIILRWMEGRVVHRVLVVKPK
jgi:hypothetical protein